MARIIAHTGFKKKAPAIKAEEKVEAKVAAKAPSKGKKKAKKK